MMGIRDATIRFPVWTRGPVAGPEGKYRLRPADATDASIE